MDGEDNDAVELVCGTIADLEDARVDALRLGKQYAVRHWIIAPSQVISREQLFEFVGRLAIEFGFDPARAVIWKHIKDRATADSCNEHYHVCVAEVDPATAGVMSSSHDRARHEKLARICEQIWGHKLILGRHTAAVADALDRDGHTDLAATLRDAATTSPRQSFDETSHQRLKRSGIDLPRTRILVTEALTTSRGLDEFETTLATLGLRLETGQKDGMPILMTSDGTTFVGSLSRLTRFTKAQLTDRMRFDDGYSAPISDHRATSPVSDSADETSRETGQRDGGSEPVGSSGHHDSAATRNGLGGGAGPRAPGTAGIPAESAATAALMLRIGCHRQHSKLLDLLFIARRAAMSPSDRVDSELHDRIEAETRILNRSGDLPEPAALLAARQAVDKAIEQLRKLERRSSELTRRIELLPAPTVWNRLIAGSNDTVKERLLAKFEATSAKIRAAQSALAGAKYNLAIEQRKFAQERSQHSVALAARQQQATKFLKVAEIARARLGRNPELAFFGIAHVLRLAALPQMRHANFAGGEHDEAGGDDVVIHDQWGKPYKPNLRASW